MNRRVQFSRAPVGDTVGHFSAAHKGEELYSTEPETADGENKREAVAAGFISLLENKLHSLRCRFVKTIRTKGRLRPCTGCVGTTHTLHLPPSLCPSALSSIHMLFEVNPSVGTYGRRRKEEFTH